MIERPERCKESDIFSEVGEQPQMVSAHAQYPDEHEEYESQDGQSKYETEETCRCHAEVVYAFPLGPKGSVYIYSVLWASIIWGLENRYLQIDWFYIEYPTVNQINKLIYFSKCSKIERYFFLNV